MSIVNHWETGKGIDELNCESGNLPALKWITSKGSEVQQENNLLDKQFVKKIRITFKKECVINDKLIIEGRKLDDFLYFEIRNNDTLLSQINLTLG